MDRLSKNHKPIALLSPKTGPFESLVRWLVTRQTCELGDDEEESDEEDGHGVDEIGPLSATVEEPSLDTKVDQLPVVPPETEDSLRWAGFNGRCNKYADTCYSFWNTASLNMMNRLTLVDATRNRRYLLEKTQHIVGGFGKGVGEPPDLLHSYFGLVSLAFQGEPGLESVDPALCASQRAVRHLHSLPWWQETKR